MDFRLKGASGELTGQPFELAEETVIGSDETASIRLEGLNERHARIAYDGQVLTLESAGEAWVNGQPVSRQALKSGDEIRLGNHRFVLQAPGLRPPSVLAAEPSSRRINPWTWVAIGAAAAAGAAGFVTLILQSAPG